MPLFHSRSIFCPPFSLVSPDIRKLLFLGFSPREGLVGRIRYIIHALSSSTRLYFYDCQSIPSTLCGVKCWLNACREAACQSLLQIHATVMSPAGREQLLNLLFRVLHHAGAGASPRHQAIVSKSVTVTFEKVPDPFCKYLWWFFCNICGNIFSVSNALPPECTQAAVRFMSKRTLVLERRWRLPSWTYHINAFPVVLVMSGLTTSSVGFAILSILWHTAYAAWASIES